MSLVKEILCSDRSIDKKHVVREGPTLSHTHKNIYCLLACWHSYCCMMMIIMTVMMSLMLNVIYESDEQDSKLVIFSKSVKKQIRTRKKKRYKKKEEGDNCYISQLSFFSLLYVCVCVYVVCLE